MHYFNFPDHQAKVSSGYWTYILSCPAYVCEIGDEYEIDIHQQIINPWPKLSWKKYINQTVTSKWKSSLVDSATTKTTMNRIRHPSDNECAHTVWLSCQGCPYLVEKAAVRARMLVGRYTLQSNRARYSNNTISSMCNICGEEEENMEHFLISCSRLAEARSDKIEALRDMYAAEDIRPPTSAADITSPILNGSAYKIDIAVEMETSAERDKCYTNTNYEYTTRAKSSKNQQSNHKLERGYQTDKTGNIALQSSRTLNEHKWIANKLASTL